MNWLTYNKRIVTATTTSRRLSSLRQFAKWAGWGPMFGDYTAPVPLKGQPHPLPEGVEGVRNMISYAGNERQAALIALCGLCGLRIAEALTVKPSDFDLHSMFLIVRGKGDKQRKVPVSRQAWQVLHKPVLEAYCEGNDREIVRLQDRHARAIVTALGVKAGLRRRVSSHDLRATFATEVYNRTKDQRLVQVLLGHASGTTTEIYIGVTDEKMHDGVEL